jgi:hypothetical protein
MKNDRVGFPGVGYTVFLQVLLVAMNVFVRGSTLRLRARVRAFKFARARFYVFARITSTCDGRGDGGRWHKKFFLSQFSSESAKIGTILTDCAGIAVKSLQGPVL